MFSGELTIIPLLIATPWLVTILSVPRLHSGCSGHHEWWVYDHNVHICIVVVQAFATYGLLTTLSQAEAREDQVGGMWALEYRRLRWISYFKVTVVYCWIFLFVTKRDPRATLAVSGLLLVLSTAEGTLTMLNSLRDSFFSEARPLQLYVTTASVLGSVLSALCVCAISASDVENCGI